MWRPPIYPGNRLPSNVVSYPLVMYPGNGILLTYDVPR